jgi:hypothetical protein
VPWGTLKNEVQKTKRKQEGMVREEKRNPREQDTIEAKERKCFKEERVVNC